MTSILYHFDLSNHASPFPPLVDAAAQPMLSSWVSTVDGMEGGGALKLFQARITCYDLAQNVQGVLLDGE